MPITNPLDFFRSGDKDDNTRERTFGKIIHIDRREEKGGYGFISSKDKPFTRIFFHWTELLSFDFMKLKKGMEVSFYLNESKDYFDEKKQIMVPGKGWIAVKVRVEHDGQRTD